MNLIKNNLIVTILVLVEYSLQCKKQQNLWLVLEGHNPCFSGILFAILKKEIKNMVKIVTILVLVEYSLQ